MQKLQIKLAILPCHSTLIPGQKVTVLTLWHQAYGRVATGVHILRVTGLTQPGKCSTRKVGFPPRSATLMVDILSLVHWGSVWTGLTISKLVAWEMQSLVCDWGWYKVTLIHIQTNETSFVLCVVKQLGGLGCNFGFLYSTQEQKDSLSKFNPTEAHKLT